jgi:acetyl esterase/lipase
VISGSPVFPRIVFYNYLQQNGLWPKEVTVLDSHLESEKLGPLCPVHHVTRAYPPTLLLHGDKDTDVPFEESVRMAAALKRHGVAHRLIRMRNYDHVFDVFPTGPGPDAEPIGLKDPEVSAAFDQVVALLRKHLGR